MAPRFRRWLKVAAIAAGPSLVLWSNHDASARKFQMSGTWIWKTNNFFLPLQFAAFAMDMTGNFLNLSMGNLTGASGFPNGPIPGSGGVTATGSAPATLRIPPHRFVEDAMTLIPENGVTLVQITTNLGIDAPYAAATLAPGGGPGSFTWCADDPACVAGGGMRSTDPPTDFVGMRNGRVIYRAGANQFGGAMQLGLRRGGQVAWSFHMDPVRIGNSPRFGVGSTLRSVPIGAFGPADLPARQTVFLPRAFVTQPTMAPAMFSPILYPGPRVTTMLGTSIAGTGAVYYLPQLATGPMGTQAGRFTTQYGFGNTTGTAIAQQTTGSNGQDFFTVMGSDQRSALGAGNISLVAGGLFFRNTLAGKEALASFQKVTLTLAPPIPSLSPTGLGAAVALVLLAAGGVLRKRFA